MDTLSQVKKWAEAGWTQMDCAQALGLTYFQFRAWRESHPEFKWPLGRSIGQRRFHESKRPRGSVEQGRRMGAARLAKMPKYTVQGVTGTVRQLALHFRVVNYGSVQERIKKGMSVEDALLRPRAQG